jgi:ATP-dependent Zn protease
VVEGEEHQAVTNVKILLINFLLRWMDLSSTEMSLFCGTNRPDVLDPALLRPGRFDLVT